MKKLALALGSLLFLLIAIAAIAPSLMDWNQYKAEAQDRIKTLTGHDIALNGDLSISLLPAPKAYVRDIVVKAVPGATAPNLASAERVDLHLALIPLLTGKIVISQISFVKPVVALETLPDGRQSWQTPELDALMNPPAEGAAATAPQTAASAATSSAPAFDISVQNFTVEDGSFSFKDKGTETALSGINLSMSADSLSGPFTGRGDFKWNDQAIDFDAQSGRLVNGADSVAVNARLNMADALSLDYAGVVGLKGDLDLQGETSLKISDLQKLAKAYGADLTAIKAASLELKGVLNATPKVISMKDLVLDLAGDKFSGSLDGSLEGDSPSIKASLAAEKPVNLDNFLTVKASGASDSASVFGGSGKGGAENAGFIPAGLTLPTLNFSADLKAPALIYKGEEYRTVALSLVNNAAGATLSLSAGTIPGQGSLDLAASLKPEAGKIASLSLSVKGSSQNLPYTLEALDLGIDPKTAENIKAASIDIDGNLYNDRVDFDNSSVEIDGTPLAFSGSYAMKGAGGKPVLRLNAAAGVLDLNKFIAGQAAPAAPAAEADGAGAAAETADIKKTLSTLSLPFDFNFDISAESLAYQDYTLKGNGSKTA
jgi:hypothetical protein